ncbi:hypothetical protein PC128_g17352 [Phytophthora cactorum]|nr:hypothetical protein PC128_g17352 [Phytophthora cactorum]
MADVRVRLVFVDDVARHVQRRRGFSSCWYLVPSDVKLVGDLAHVLLREFELRKRCPKGLELRLEELPLLATQSIRVVRDNDTIVIQCPPLKDHKESSSESSSSESEEEVIKTRKRKLHKKEKQEQPKKKNKNVKHVEKEVKDRPSASTKDCGVVAVKTIAGAKKNSKGESSSSSSSSESDGSSGSSSESSSSSESEDEAAAQSNGKRVTQDATTKQQLGKSKGKACAKTPNDIASKANALEQTGKEPRRRRRRLRQRNGRRHKNGNEANNADGFTSLAPLSGNGTASLRQDHAATPSDHVPSSGRQSGGSIAGPRGYPRSKAHVLFDEVTGDQVAVQHNEAVPVTRGNDLASRRSPAPELAKYGPSSSDNQRSRAPRNSQDQISNGLTDEAVDANGANKRKGKGKYEERWKRPYEILATVLDKKPQNSSKNTTSPPDLSKALASYPAVPVASSSFEPKDVIAFKTLTLCLETWQPVLSEWKCGQVQSVDASGNTIEVASWVLEVNGESVDFCESPSDELYSVQTSEISELRFLSGPSYASLQQSAPSKIA